MPTQSMTLSAPLPLLISLIRSNTSSFSKSMMSVAPDFSASAIRSGTVSMTMMRSAPMIFADWIAKIPTGPGAPDGDDVAAFDLGVLKRPATRSAGYR